MEYDGTPELNAQSNNIHYLKFPQKDKLTAENDNNQNGNLSATSNYASLESQILNNLPSLPVYAIRPDNIKKAAQWFLANFSGKVLYSVKSNPEVAALKHLNNAGVNHFDVASLNEIKLISGLFPNSKMYFMHPIKAREAIHAAYFDFGIRDFSLDSSDELKKILEVTNNAKDLNLHVRLGVSGGSAAIDLSGKFGILPSESVALIRKVRSVAQNLGICFHVGSQCMDPAEYRYAITIAKDVITAAKVKLDVLDVGGGFPSSYPGLTPPALQSYIDEINDAVKSLGFESTELWCEPGRALVAESGSLVVRVEARKNQMLYLNDGTYGGLFDAGHPSFIYHSKTMRAKGKKALLNNLIPFGFYGPTCDSLDAMKGPFYLPENIAEGDYIEIGGLGAYSKSLRTNFNGFNDIIEIEVSDKPLVSMYEEEQANAEEINNKD